MKVKNVLVAVGRWQPVSRWTDRLWSFSRAEQTSAGKSFSSLSRGTKSFNVDDLSPSSEAAVVWCHSGVTLVSLWCHSRFYDPFACITFTLSDCTSDTTTSLLPSDLLFMFWLDLLPTLFRLFDLQDRSFHLVFHHERKNKDGRHDNSEVSSKPK